VKRSRALIVCLTLLFLSCTKSNKTPSVAISPTSVTVGAGAEQQFMATVTNATEDTVTWQVNGTAGGNSSVGTISSSGLYTAPETVPSPATVTVAAVSQADTSASASASVTITSSTVGIAPGSVTVSAAATQQFTATVKGESTPAVTWQVNGTTGGTAAAGTIDSTGLYTAPAIPPSGQQVTVTAVSEADPSMTASATVTVAPSVATLNGSYAFVFIGQSSGVRLVEAGSFQADGKGNVTGGIEDVNNSSKVFTNVSFTGTYTVGQDGRGSLVITPPGFSGLSKTTFELVLISNQQARLIAYNSFSNGWGRLDLQDSSAFSNSALSGNYVFSFSGADGSGLPFCSIGYMTLNGSGSISGGSLDSNDNGGVATGLTLTGNYSTASSGRGTLTLNSTFFSYSFAYYVVSAQTLRLVSIGSLGGPVWSGSANSQQSGVDASTALSGPFVFEAGGTSGVGTFADAGQFQMNSGGIVTNGVGDENYQGMVTTGYAFTGSYTLTTNSNGTLQFVSNALGTFNYSFYLQSNTQAVVLRTDFAAVTSGTLEAQAQSTFSLTDFSGPYGFNLDGNTVTTTAANSVPIDKLGQLSADGKGNATGNQTLNTGTALTANVALTITNTVQSTGRGTLKITGGGTTRLVNFYLVSPNSLSMIGMDSDQALLGGADQQFQ
jgi:hypothetical protein